MMIWLLTAIFLPLLSTWNANAQIGGGVSMPTTPNIPINPPDTPSGTTEEIPQNDVVTPSGPVRGQEVYFVDDIGPCVQEYLGIPFATPPVGPLRFRKPQPIAPWTKVLDATKQPPGCIQYSEYPFPWYDSEDGKSEDCLYLNVWTVKHKIQTTPTGIKGLLPVIVWIYGGGFTTGSIRQEIYNGSGFASLANGTTWQPVVFVTINYRMGAFGFLNAKTQSAPGNVGLYDMVEALKWIKLNILAFGGDPARITIAGQGSGAVAVGLLCVSPLADGLFIRAIMESGSPAYLFAEDNSQNTDKSQKLAEALECADEDTNIYDNPEKVVNCLRDVDAMKIAKTLNSFSPTSTYFFYPNYGDDILPQNARKALIDGNFNNKDIIIGVNGEEGSNLLTTANPHVFGFFGEKDPEINKTYGEYLLRNYFRDFEDPDAVVQYYLTDVADNDYDGIRRQVYTAIGDYSILCPTEYFADSYGDANRVRYYYLNNRPNWSRWAKWMGVAHFEDVEYVFGETDKLGTNNVNNTYIDDTLLAKFFVRTWTSFANDGLETIFQNYYDEWPLYTRENRTAYGMFTRPGPLYELNTFKYVEVPHSNNCDFFREYFGFSDKKKNSCGLLGVVQNILGLDCKPLISKNLL